MTTPFKRIQYLRNEIIRHDELYEQNRPIIADGEYDELYFELVRLENEHPEYYDATSPTQRIVTSMVDELKKVNHTHFTGSQEKAKDWNSVLKFVNQGTGNILVQHKLDGLTVALRYENGYLVRAVTRGDGTVGEDVTHTVRTIRNLPKRILYKGNLDIRMEAVIPFEEFERINENADYSNPRNLVSGTIRQLDPDVARSRNVVGIVFDFLSSDEDHYQNDTERLQFLRDQGFTVVSTQSYAQDEQGLEGMKSFIGEMGTAIRQTLPYLIDGLIIKFDSLSVRDDLGSTNKHPKWSIAYKFESQEATTKFLSLAEQVGKSGQITPVAELAEVTIGVNIRRASLHNYGYVSEGDYFVGKERRTGKDIRIGDMVTLVRANDVIPKITNSIKELRTGEEIVIVPPKTCPECNSPTEFIGANLYCTGIDCKPQLAGKIEHFGSRKALNIDGLGDSTAAMLFDLGIIRHFLDLYRLEEHRERIISVPGFGEKTLNHLLEGLEQAKEAPLSKVLTALSIRLIGSTQSKELSKQFSSMQSMLDASLDKEQFFIHVQSFDGFGEERARTLAEFFANELNRELIKGLLAVGFTMKGDGLSQEEKTANEHPNIKGKTFVITGKLSRSRDEFKDMVEKMGGKVSGSVSAKTHFLLMGSDAQGSTKHQKALSSGTVILFEDGFWNLIG